MCGWIAIWQQEQAKKVAMGVVNPKHAQPSEGDSGHCHREPRTAKEKKSPGAEARTQRPS